MRANFRRRRRLHHLRQMSGHFAQGRFSAFRPPAAQLLIIIGDGHGTLNQGAERVSGAINRLLDEGVVVLYLIVDNPNSSIFKVSKLEGARLVNYLSVFPFPFYAVVQSTDVIPLCISEAIRQFFELV